VKRVKKGRKKKKERKRRGKKKKKGELAPEVIVLKALIL